MNEPQFKVKLLNAITLLKSDCPMSEKIPAARSIIEKILVDPRNKTMDIYFLPNGVTTCTGSTAIFLLRSA